MTTLKKISRVVNVAISRALNTSKGEFSIMQEMFTQVLHTALCYNVNKDIEVGVSAFEDLGPSNELENTCWS